MRIGRSLVVLATLGSAAAACTGILGLDQTSLRGQDGGGEDSSAPTEASGMDVTQEAVATDGPGPDAPNMTDSGVPHDAPSGDASDAGADGPVFTTNPSALLVAQSGSLPVTVSVQRNGFAPGALAVTFTQLPSGVTSSTGTIAADAGAATVTVSASNVATIGSSTASLQANGKTYATVPLTVAGASGSIDTTFQGGYVVGSQSGALFTAVAVDPQGGIVAAGSLTSGAWLLRRFLPDGSDDTTFDTKAAAVLPASGGGLFGMSIDPATGDIVLAGTANSSQLTIVVLSAAGTASGAFNGGLPYASTPVFTQSSIGFGAAVLPAQTFFAVGSSTQGTSGAAISVPLTESTATPPGDPFGNSGVATANTTYYAAAADPSGRLVAAGSGAKSGMPTSILLGRYTKTGAIDTTFGDAGGPFIEGDFYCTGNALAVRPKGGTVFVGGTDQTAGNLNGCFGEWSPAGALLYWKLGTAGGGGPFTYAGAAPMGDLQDRIYIVGSGGDMFAKSAELDRLLIDGSYDPTFGGTGQVELDPGGSPPSFYFTLKAVAVQADDRIVIAGQRTGTTGSFPVVGRFWP